MICKGRAIEEGTDFMKSNYRLLKQFGRLSSIK